MFRIIHRRGFGLLLKGFPFDCASLLDGWMLMDLVLPLWWNDDIIHVDLYLKLPVSRFGSSNSQVTHS